MTKLGIVTVAINVGRRRNGAFHVRNVDETPPSDLGLAWVPQAVTNAAQSQCTRSALLALRRSHERN